MGVLTTGCYHNTSSVVHLRSSPLFIPDGFDHLFLVRSIPRLLTAAPQGGLQHLPAQLLRRISSSLSPLHLFIQHAKALSLSLNLCFYFRTHLCQTTQHQPTTNKSLPPPLTYSTSSWQIPHVSDSLSNAYPP